MGGEGQFCGGVQQAGLTLVELLVVIAMVAIVLAIGIPAYQNFTTSNTLLAELHTLKGDLALARSEASTTGSNVVICPSTNPTGTNPVCSGTNEWNTGWVILSPTGSSCTATSGIPLKVQGAFLSKDTIVFNGTGNVVPTSFCFNRNGLPDGNTTATNLPGMFAFNTTNNNAGDRLCLNLNGAAHMQILAAGQSGCP